MVYPKIKELIGRLATRTREGVVPWEKTLDENTFQAAFPGYTIRISSRPTKAPNFEDGAVDYLLQIFNEEGKLIEEVSDIDFEDPASWFTTLREIHDTARRMSMGVEQALNALLDSLYDPKDDIPF